MLLRLKAVFFSCKFTEVQETADLAAKFGQVAVLIESEIPVH